MAITYDLVDGVARVAMDDGKANALNDASCSALDDALARAAADAASALVLTGREGVFCGGIDLGLLREPDAGARAAGLEHIGHTLLRVWTAPLPTIAVVAGHAIAGGAILAMACDRRIARAGPSKLGVNETALGLVFPTWATVIATAALKPEALVETFLLGRLMGPADALRVGLVDAVVAADGVDAAVRAAVDEAVALPTRAYGANKARLRAAEAQRADALVAEEMGARFARDVRLP